MTRAGEDILSEYDDWAIRELRAHQLVWSGWGPMVAVTPEHLLDKDHGARRITVSDPSRLRLFFLSLLWRAAATTSPGFSEVSLPSDDLERLRVLLVDRNPGPLDFYPTQLTQLSTRGPIHNQGPIAGTKLLPNLADDTDLGREVPFFRFYFDGLIAHTHRPVDGACDAGGGNMVVGASATLLISTVTFEASFQRENLRQLIQETSERWPEEMRRLHR